MEDRKWRDAGSAAVARSPSSESFGLDRRAFALQRRMVQRKAERSAASAEAGEGEQLEVSQPEDSSEKEADSVAEGAQFMSDKQQAQQLFGVPGPAMPPLASAVHA